MLARRELENITQFVAHPPSNFSQQQVAAAIRAMNRQPGVEAGLRKRAFELADKIDNFLAYRTKHRPTKADFPSMLGDKGYESGQRFEEAFSSHEKETIQLFRANGTERLEAECLAVGDAIARQGIDIYGLKQLCQNPDRTSLALIPKMLREVAGKLSP